MAAGYDGTLRFDTRTDTKGFNAGLSKVRTSMNKVGSALFKVATGAIIAFSTVALVVGFIVRGLINVFKSTVEATKKMIGYAGKVDELKNLFENLKLAVADAFRPLILFALPWIQKVIAWVSGLLSMIGQVLAGLTGQDGYWKSTAVAAGSTAASTKKVADNTKKAGEAAKGALAAFDELNVLQMAEDEETGGGGEAGSGVATEWVPLGEKALGIVAKIQEFLARVKDFFAPLMEPLGRIWDAFGRIWEQLKRTTESILKDLGPVFIWLRDNVLLPILNLLAGVFEKIATWMEENPEEVKAMAIAFGVLALALLLILSPAAQVIAIILAVIVVVGLLIKYWPEISRVAAIVVNAVINFFVNLWNSIKTGVVDMYNAVVKWFTNLWTGIKNVWSIAKAWFQVTVIDPIVRAWNTATTSIKGFFTRTFDAIKSTVKGVINQIIDFVNNLISNIVSGINNVITLANNIPGVSIDMITAPKIPHLASGAVIPPNAAFLAMLGDQRSGTNIEAPEELIRQIVREETGAGGGEITINFGGSLGALVRELKPYIDKENARIGRSLVKGVTA